MFDLLLKILWHSNVNPINKSKMNANKNLDPLTKLLLSQTWFCKKFSNMLLLQLQDHSMKPSLLYKACSLLWAFTLLHYLKQWSAYIHDHSAAWWTTWNSSNDKLLKPLWLRLCKNRFEKKNQIRLIFELV